MNVMPIGRAGGGGGGCGAGDGNGHRLHRKPPPHFLTKTYEMVKDPKTNDLISWSETGKSLVIWDQHRFAKDLLPQHFKHNNFSSFVYQLNSYGFKKISSVHCEYENPFFQADNEHLLYNIKKRPKSEDINAPRKRARKSPGMQDSGPDGSDRVEIEKLKNKLNKMEMELWELKQQQDATKQCLEDIKKNIKGAEMSIKQEVYTFMTNAILDPLFVKNFLKLKQSLVTHHSAGVAVKDEKLNLKNGEDLTTINSEMSSDPNLKGDEQSIALAKKLLLEEEEDLVWEKGAEDQMGQCQSRIVMELEDLIPKPSGRDGYDWAKYVMELRQKSGLP